ncbi:MAG: glutamate 5-kinase [Acidimicrobiales bacterium]|nr:glutamate 5-kinase [Acidimicrobiales bacterium]MDP6298949.1 glutamate 5-kinase [Acidimicrobiales bacterium]HJM27818.1 glutamate 5-kinase [Acidimicrobiales bacterium]HJM97265.1 glutamate 5-kinase [Acidimicrobiales bacterium]
MTVVVKIGTSSLTDRTGLIKGAAIEKLCSEISDARKEFSRIVLVTSGAIGAGLPALGYSGNKPSDSRILQAASAIGQPRLMATYSDHFSKYDIPVAQLLMAPDDFFIRKRYLHARSTMEELLTAGILPIVNENDAIADDAIRWGDNDRIAALLAQLLNADHLLMLTDTEGVFSRDPNEDSSEEVELIHEIKSQEDLVAQVTDSNSFQGSGGMASKLAAAQMASWAGVTTTIAAATQSNIVLRALRKDGQIGTTIRPHHKPLSARKLWIAFALEPKGELTIDVGAQNAITEEGASLLAVGILQAKGEFAENDTVNILNANGEVIARGLSSVSSEKLISLLELKGKKKNRTGEIIHRDELVILRT